MDLYKERVHPKSFMARQRRGKTGFYLTLIAISLCGMMLRFVHVSKLHYSPTGDQQVYPAYGEIYERWWNGEKLGDEDLYLTSRNPPGYPIVVAVFRACFGKENFQSIYFFQAFCDAITTLLIGLIGRHLYGARSGILACIGYSLYHMAIIYTAQLQTETLSLLFMTASVYVYVMPVRKRVFVKAIFIGLLLGFAAHFRLNLVVLLGVFGIFSLIPLRRWIHLSRTERIGIIALPAIYSSVTILCLLPVSIRNSRILGHPVIMVGSNAERFLLGANPNSKGEWVSYEPIPRDWQKEMEGTRQQREAAAKRFSHDFLWVSHSVYYWFTVVPTKFWALLFTEHWVYVGQHPGNTIELPFGPFLRCMLITSKALVIVGLIGIFIRGRRHPRFALACFLIIFTSIQMLIIEARYRLPAEVFLMLMGAAVIQRTYFTRQFTKRLAYVAGGWALVGIGWSSINAVRFGGPNLLDNQQVLASSSTLQKMVKDTFVFDRGPDAKAAEASLLIGTFPVDAGKCSHLYFEFSYSLERPSIRTHDYATWTDAWPDILVKYCAYDDKDTTLSLDYRLINAAELNNFQTAAAKQWRVMELHGRTKKVSLFLTAKRGGTIKIWDMKAKGPVWYNNQ